MVVIHDGKSNPIQAAEGVLTLLFKRQERAAQQGNDDEYDALDLKINVKKDQLASMKVRMLKTA